MEGEPRIDPAALGLGLLLGLVGGDLERGPVLEFLTTAQVPWENLHGEDAEVSAPRWDKLAADAGIVSGIDAWRTKLEEARKRREEREYEDDRDLRLYDSLRKVIDRLHDDLTAFPKEGGWGDFLKATLALLDTWIKRNRLVRERLERVLGPMGRYAANMALVARISKVRPARIVKIWPSSPAI